MSIQLTDLFDSNWGAHPDCCRVVPRPDGPAWTVARGSRCYHGSAVLTRLTGGALPGGWVAWIGDAPTADEIEALGGIAQRADVNPFRPVTHGTERPPPVRVVGNISRAEAEAIATAAAEVLAARDARAAEFERTGVWPD